jgi:single-strand DNA-binding protein
MVACPAFAVTVGPVLLEPERTRVQDISRGGHEAPRNEQQGETMEVRGWVGNLVEDLVLDHTSGGTETVRVRAAFNRSYTDKNGQKVEKACYFTLRLWRDLARNAAASGLRKGSRVLINGEFEQRSYETDAGEKRTAEEIRVDEIGPSLRWATIKGEIERQSSNSGGGYNRAQAGNDRQRNEPAPVAAAAGRSADTGDDDPFGAF